MVNRSETDILVEFVKRLKPKRTLEVGCNSGKELEFIKDFTKTFGIDKNIELVKGKKNLKCAYGEEIPYGNNSFDLVYTDGCLSHNEVPEPILDEMVRVSKNKILLIEWIGSKTGTSGYSNCKVGLSWIHDYEKLIAVKKIKILFSRQIVFGYDLFHVILMEKDKRKITKIVEKIPEKKSPLLSINFWKFKFEVGK